MKKVGMLCLSILVLCWGLLGCTNGEEIPSASGVSSETASEEGGPVVICADAPPKAAPRPRGGEEEEGEEEEDAAAGRGGRRGGEARPEGRARGSPADRDQVPPLHRGVAGRDALPAGGGAETPQAEGRHLERGQLEPPQPARSLCSRPPGLGDAALAAARGGRGGPRAAPAPPAGRSAREQRPEAGGRPGE